MSGFVLFDTQMIMEKRRAGSTDCIKHSMDLFFDLISMFRRLLIILTQKVRARQQHVPLLGVDLTNSIYCVQQEEREQRKRKNK